MYPPIVNIANQALRLAPKNKNLISFGQGVPFFGPPKDLLNQVLEEWKDPNHFVHRYNHDQGVYSLREAISKFEKKRYNLPELNPDKEIMVTAGANQGCFNVIKTICSPGDEVIIFSPFYFNHEMAVAMEGLKVSLVPVNRETLSMDVNEIEKSITSKTKLIILVNPNNPTGVLENKHKLLELLELLEKHKQIWLMSDETYAEFVFNEEKTGSFHSIGSLKNNVKDRTVVIRSFSKAWGIPGWRAGYIVFPESILEPLFKVQDTLIVSPPVPAQLLAEACLRWSNGLEWLQDRIKEINKVRRFLIGFLNENQHFTIHKESFTGQSAFYVFPELNLDSMIKSDLFVENLVKTEAVLMLPGTAFGNHWKNNIRISFGNVTLEDAKIGTERIQHFLDKIHYERDFRYLK
jgi:aspartate/methionine/tyrosine aminotransferase